MAMDAVNTDGLTVLPVHQRMSTTGEDPASFCIQPLSAGEQNEYEEPKDLGRSRASTDNAPRACCRCTQTGDQCRQCKCKRNGRACLDCKPGVSE